MKSIAISIDKVKQSMRMDGSYHNADINVYDDILQEHSSHCLDFYCSSIYTTGRGRRVYTRPDHGVPFLSNSDMTTQDPLMSCNYMSRKYGYDEPSLLKGGMILTGRVGAIGQTAFVPKYWEKHSMMGSDNIIRIVVNEQYKNGFIYAYLASKYGNLSFWKHTTGGVQPFITDKMVAELPIPDMSVAFQQEVDDLIQESARLREEAADMLEKSKNLLKEKAGLDNLVSEDYDYYGHRSADRKASCFSIKRKDITTTTINAFNLSERIRKTKEKIQSRYVRLGDVIENGRTFSSTSSSSVEVSPNNGVMFVNQKDIFDNIIKGKWVSKRGFNPANCIQQGEVLVACDGTLGESEFFCHALYAGEELSGKLISSHFMRMRGNGTIPMGYLFAWLDTDYGFRFIRNTQAGTKICHPIQKLFVEIPVPLIDSDSMQKIDRLVREAHTKRYQANCNERKAISMVEKEIESWTTSKKN
ncbi:restriction endonuclease subunit S [Prevotella aurantiaca]|uniref:methylation-associated defense system restriction endonuclease subunit S MAD5 n=1 Tax=Prevotella aurantiaca TaxID=596085 RepID=UPI0028EF7EBA|nr:restriction endonuclease subunit S [Prevotella aurantiaca]